MDIAKIRKKGKGTEEIGKGLPEAESRQGGTGEERETASADHPQEAVAEREVSDREGAAPDETVEILTFSLASEEYAFKVSEILEIIKPQRITAIPRSEPYLVGITSLRGKIIPVIDLKRRLSLGGRDGDGRKQKILIVKGPEGPIGVQVDRVIGVIRTEVSKIEETPPHLQDAEMRFIEGVVSANGRFVSIMKTTETLDIAAQR